MIKILFLLLLSGVTFAQPKDRVAVKDIRDGFEPKGSKTMTVAELEKIAIVKVKNNTPRMAEEKQVIEVTGTIAKMQKELDGDIHCEITDGTIKDSTLACEFPDPSTCKSPYKEQFAAARKFIQGKHVGDKVTLSGILFEDKFHSPSPKRIRNFLEIHPVLNAK